MAPVVKWLRPRIVVPICMGSNPIRRPIFKNSKIHKSLKRLFYFRANFFFRVFKVNMNNNSISFTSKIRFVDRPVYAMMEKSNLIGFRHNVPNILKDKTFYSEEIRTCTGGGLVNPFKEAEGFHFWDDLPNKKNFDILINRLFRFVKSPEHGLLVGGKDLKNSPFSMEQFLRFKKVFLERVKNVSFFQKHNYEYSETHFHYSLDTDTWTLCSSFLDSNPDRYRTVNKIADLRKCFDKISIAEGDKLFLGKKEILPDDAPDIFAIYQKKQQANLNL